MLPDDAILDASKKLIDFGVIGAVCIMLIAALAWLGITYRTDMRRKDEENQRIREAHLADVKNYATIGESVRDQIKPALTAFQTAVEILKDRNRP